MSSISAASYCDRVVTPASSELTRPSESSFSGRGGPVPPLDSSTSNRTFAAATSMPLLPHGHGRSSGRRPHAGARAKRIIDLVKDHVPRDPPSTNGASRFLNPTIFEVVRYAHDAGLFTVINSNLRCMSRTWPGRSRPSGWTGCPPAWTASPNGRSRCIAAGQRRPHLRERSKAIARERARQGVVHPVLELAFLVSGTPSTSSASSRPEARDRRGRLPAPPAFIFHASFVPENPDSSPCRRSSTGPATSSTPS